MTTAQILGQTVKLEIELPDADDHRTEIETRFQSMAMAINRAKDAFSPDQAKTFELTRTLTIFRSKTFRGRHISRSFMDQRERNFHWTLGEYLAWDPEPRRSTAYFHDAWHVRQFLSLGEPPNDEEILIDREVDAMAQQLEVARLMNADQAMIDFLKAFADDRERIRERLRSGIGIDAHVEAHFLIFD